MNTALALPRTEARTQPVTAAQAAAAVLAVVALAPPLLGGLVVLDWADTVETAVVGLLEAVAVGVWVARGGRLPRASVRHVPALALAWLAACVLATAAATDLAPAVVRTAACGLHVAFGCVVWSEAARTRSAWCVVERGASAGFAVAIALGLFLWVLDARAGFVRDWMYDVPFVSGIRWAGVYGLVGVAFSARVVSRTDGRSSEWGAIALGVLGWAALWWSASRGALGGAVIAVAVAVWGARGRRGALLRFGAVIAAGAAVSLLASDRGANIGLWRFLDGESAPLGSAAFTSGRTILWAMGLEAWRAHPWLGLGPGAAVSLFGPVGNAHAHNAVVQALVEWGLVGTAPFLALAGVLVWRSVGIAARDLRDVRSGAALYLVATAAAAMLDGLTSDPATTALMAAAAALVCAPRRGTEARTPGHTAWARAVTGGAALAALVLAGHLLLLRAVWMPGTPAPGSARARLVLAAPTYPFAKEIEGWGRAWMATDPAAADRVAAWGLARDRSPWLFLRLRADAALRRGDTQAAQSDYRAAAAAYEARTAGFARYVSGDASEAPE